MRYGVENTGKFRTFIEIVRDKPRPSEGASVKWLKGYGFTSSKDPQFLHILELLKFVDGSRKPVIRWKDFQVKENSGKVMTEAILEGYKVLYDRYPTAHNASKEDLERVFIIEKELTDRQAKDAVRTFNVLIEFADRGVLDKKVISTPTPKTPTPHTPPSTITPVTPAVVSITPEQMSELIQQKRELGVNINIQVTLPETTEAKVYETIFAALKKYFFSE